MSSRRGPDKGTRSLDVTIVTVVRNAIAEGRARAFVRCLDSVQAQEGLRAEHLVIDGASDDGTLELLSARSPGRIPLVVSSEPDRGIYDAMNRGLRLARGKYVIFLNSDDHYCNPTGLAQSFGELEKSGADFSFAPATILGEFDGREIETALTHPDLRHIFVRMGFSHQTMMVRRDLALAQGGFDIRYRSSADYDLVLRLVLNGARGHAVNNRFAVFREGGFSYQNRELAYREVGEIMSRHYSRLAASPISAEQGLFIYRNRRLPAELHERLRPLYERSFGQSGALALARRRPHVSFALLRELADFKFGLMTFKTGGSVRSRLKAMLTAVLRYPVWSARFALACFRVRKSVLPKLVARVAYARLAKEIFASANEVNRPGIAIESDDYWQLPGAYEAEPWGVWATRELVVRVPVPEGMRGCPLVCTAYLGRYAPMKSVVSHLRIDVNGSAVAEFDLISRVPGECRFDVPCSLTDADELRVRCLIDRDFRPCECGLGDDDRRLGISFSGLTAEIANTISPS